MMVLWTVRAALRILPRRLRWKWAALAPLILAATAVELLAAGTIYLMVRRASSGTISISFVAVVAAVFLGRNLLQWIVAMLQSSVTAQSMAAVFSALLAGTLAAPYRFHLQHRPTEQIQRLTAAIDTAYRLVLASAAGLASEILIVIALTALLIVKAPLNAGITAVILSSAVIAVLAGTRRSVARWGREVYERGGQTIAHVQEILGGVREVKSAQRERPFLERAAAVQMEFSEALRRHLLALAVPRLVTETSFVIIALAMVVFLAAEAQGIGDLLALLALFAYIGFRLIPSVNRVIFHLDHIRHGEHAVAELDAAFREIEPFRLPARPRRDFEFRDAIELRDVSFTYEGGVSPALSNFSMTIAKGEWVGLAGENGAGKSTLLDLVAGLLSPTSGSIRIDRRPLDEWLATSPPLFGYVPQHPHIFDDTVGNNVTLGDGHPAVSIGLDPNTNALRLSGGEKQRVAVARALNDLPPILLFDEPTAALDAETEAYFARVLSRLKGRTTAIIVSHRPETLAWCDRVVHLGTDVSAPALRRQWPESDRETAPAQTSSPAP